MLCISYLPITSLVTQRRREGLSILRISSSRIYGATIPSVHRLYRNFNTRYIFIGNLATTDYSSCRRLPATRILRIVLHVVYR